MQTLVLAKSTDQFIAFQHANRDKECVRVNTPNQLRGCDPSKTLVVFLTDWYTRYNDEIVEEIDTLIYSLKLNVEEVDI